MAHDHHPQTHTTETVRPPVSNLYCACCADDGDWIVAALRLGSEASWSLEEDGYDPVLEREVESRFAIANGFLGVRASLETPTPASRPRTYIAGLFDESPGTIGGPTLIPGPDWLRVNIRLDRELLSLESGDVIEYRRRIDLRSGVLISDWVHRLSGGIVASVQTLRLVSLANRATALQLVRVTVDAPVTVTLEPVLSSVTEALVLGEAKAEVTTWRTAESGRHLAVASHCDFKGARPLPRRGRTGCQPVSWTAGPKQPVDFFRTIAVSAEGDIVEARQHALRSLTRARRAGPRAMVAAQARAWSRRWQKSDVIIEGDDEAQKALRFAVYHLNSAANADDGRVSIGARALTGDAYSGHVFWDTDIFLVPFYILTWPAAARALLMYRWHTLSAARRKAARLGFRGALYAWESADTGEETTLESALLPDGQVVAILSGAQEHHISADVAYAVWRYWESSGDSEFLRSFGAEIIFETARFWASRATLEGDGSYHIRNVIGPDEYHEDVDDNAYTNVMASWNLERGIELVGLFQKKWPARWSELNRKLKITAGELETWTDVSRRLATGLDPMTGLCDQFAGFLQLEPVDLASYEPRTAPIDVVLGRERTQRSQAIKQADVVMLLALLWDRFAPDVRAKNFRYYEPRTGHGSSLSPPIHALVAARLGDVEVAERYFRETAAIDAADSMGNAAGGVHIGALGGLWQAVVFGFAGLTVRSDGLSFDPHLPRGWRSISYPIQWRGRFVRVRADPDSCTVELERGKPMNVWIGGLRQRLKPGETRTWDLVAADAAHGGPDG